MLESETEFWSRLEFRVTSEFSGMEEPSIRRYWCDGFIPERYELDRNDPVISGRAWIAVGSDQEVWDFTLFLGRRPTSIDGVDWQKMLPPERATEWIQDSGPSTSENYPTDARHELRR